MSELQHYYDNFKTGYWATENAADCPCHGNGFALSEVDTWHKCPVHYAGQLSPEDLDTLCGATPEEIEAAEALEKAKWKLDQAKSRLAEAHAKVHSAEYEVKVARDAFLKAQGVDPTPEPVVVVAVAEAKTDEDGDDDIPF